MVVPSEIVKIARDLVGTPYQHQGRVAGEHGGLDCIGLPLIVCRLAGLGYYDYFNYSREPDGTLIRELDKHWQRLPDIKEGSLLVFAIRKEPQHCAIASKFRGGWGMIHAYENAGQVREHALIPWWRKKITHFYALPGVDYD